MPGKNRMGPMGGGAMSGRGLGRCRGANDAGNFRRRGIFTTVMPGWMRFGVNDPEAQTPDAETERQELQRQAAILRAQLARIEERLKDAPEPEQAR